MGIAQCVRSTGALTILVQPKPFHRTKMMLLAFPSYLTSIPSCLAAESYVKPEDERANCYPILIKDAWLFSLALNFILLSRTPSKLLLEESRLSLSHTSDAPSTLSLPRAFSISPLIEIALRQISAWYVQSCLFFFSIFLISFLGFLTWSPWAFRWKTVELWSLYLILLSSTTCCSI